MTSGQDAGAVAAPERAAGDGVRDDEVLQDGSSGPASSGSAEAVRTRGTRVWTGVLAVLLVALLASLATAGFFLLRVRGFDAAASRREAVAAAARSAVTDLTTADYQHPQRYVDRLRPQATGRFLSVFANSATGFRAVLTAGKVQTVGHVADVGVRQISPQGAQVTVLAYVTVRNSQTPGGSQRIYRLSVSLIPAGSRWLVSNVVFVR